MEPLPTKTVILGNKLKQKLDKLDCEIRNLLENIKMFLN